MHGQSSKNRPVRCGCIVNRGPLFGLDQKGHNLNSNNCLAAARFENHRGEGEFCTDTYLHEYVGIRK